MITVFDTETTSLFEPEVVQAAFIGYSMQDKGIACFKEKLFGTSKPIEFGAMGTHNITNEDVKGRKKWSGNFLPIHTEYLVAHNTQFDTQFFKPEELVNVKVLCTLKLAKKLIPKHECGDHKNSTLYYYLGCYKNPVGKEYLGKTHTALSDCCMTLNVLLAMLSKYKLTIHQAYAMITNIDDSNPVLEDINICPFPKHAGKAWVEVIKVDKDYCHWLLDGGKIKNPAMVELVRGLM